MIPQNNDLRVNRLNALFLLVGLLLFIAFLFYAGNFLLINRGTSQGQKYNQPSVASPPQGRVLVILLDSLREDFAFSDRMPFLSSLRERGAWGISEVVSVPVSIAGDRAIFSGTIANPLVILEDFNPRSSTSENLISRVDRKSGRAVVFGELVHGAYGINTNLSAFEPKAFRFNEYRDKAAHIFSQAYSFLSNKAWDLAVVQFITLDYLGHLETPFSPDYPSTLLLMDDYVRKFVGLLRDRDTVLITSEHGMDDRGFHIDRTPLVIRTPFVLWGPSVIKGGPKRVLQIDWAPTLSLLLGVSPFYDSPALPALDLIEIPRENTSHLLKRFTAAICGASSVLSLDELRKKRLALLGMRHSPFAAGATGLMVWITATLIANAALSRDRWKSGYSLPALTGMVVLCLGTLLGLLSYLGLLERLSCSVPFRADFFFNQPWKTATAFAAFAILPAVLLFMAERKGVVIGDFPQLFLYTFIFSGLFLCPNPYHVLNWAIFTLPLVGWGISRRSTWLLAFAALWFGLALRRLTFYNVFNPIHLPDRGILGMLILASGLAVLLWRLKRAAHRGRTVGFTVLLFLPALVAMSLPLDVEIRALILVCVGLLCLFCKGGSGEREIRLAVWVTLFYLGTSGSINHMTHLVAFPLILSMWSLGKGAPVQLRSIMICFILWALYFLPGNTLSLNLLELNDRFILGSAVDEHIHTTVLIIAGRYILPITVIVWGLSRDEDLNFTLRMAAATFLPVVFCIGLLLTFLLLSPAGSFPWNHLSLLAILSGYALVILCAFAIVWIFKLFFGERFRQALTFFGVTY